MTTRNTTPLKSSTLQTTWWLLAATCLLAGCVSDPGQPTAQEDAQQNVGATTPHSGASQAATQSETTDDAPSASHLSTDQVDGSRIQARMLRTDEGYENWVGWKDTALHENCDFEQDAEGTLRCFPTHAARDVYYTDAACTAGIAAVDAVSPETIRYAYEREPVGCGEGIRPYSLADAIEAPAEIFARVDGRCVAQPAPAVTFYALGAEVALESFVAARYGVQGNSARVKAVGLVADDGAVRVTGFFDSALNTSCAWQGSTEASCVPSTQGISLFADDMCSMPLLEAQTDSCTQRPSIAVSYDADGCNAQYYRPGAPFQGSTVYELSADAYQVKTVSSDEASSLRMGIPLGEDQFAPGAAERMDSATTRLTPVNWVTPDGGVWFGHWYDNDLQTACSFVSTDEHGWRCIPDQVAEDLVYADAECKRPVAEVSRFGACGAPLETPSFVKTQTHDATGHSVVEVRRLLRPRPMLAVHTLTDDGKCEGRVAAENRQYFEVSEPMRSTAFVEGKLSDR